MRGPRPAVSHSVARKDGPVSEPELVPLQTHQEQQTQQEAEPLAVAVPGQGARAEALQVPGEQAKPAAGVAVPLALHQHGRVPARAGPGARLVPARPHRHLRAHGEQAQQPGREAEAGGGGEESGVRAAAKNSAAGNRRKTHRGRNSTKSGRISGKKGRGRIGEKEG